MPIYQLTDEIMFPNPDLAEDDGLLAIGGDLRWERLLLAYCNGIFPWFNENDPILWWCPKPRFIINPNEVKISKSMKRVFNKGEFKVTFDKDFNGVISNCKGLRENKEGTWITDDMKKAYITLFNKGFASSVEVYKGERLVGGLYGVKIGRCFFGESMFSTETNASKVALISMCKKFKEEGYLFLDCQMHTNHLESMGGKFVSWEEFKDMLQEGIGLF